MGHVGRESGVTRGLQDWLQRADEDIAASHVMLAEAGALLEQVDSLLEGAAEWSASGLENRGRERQGA